MKTCLLIALVAFTASSAVAQDPAYGWRGNGTGLWPGAHPPLHWHRLPQGALEDLRATALRPSGAGPGTANPVEKGLVRDWLVVGPFPVKDSVKNFDDDLLDGEATIRPMPGQKVGANVWTVHTSPADDIHVFGTAELPWLDLGKAFRLGEPDQPVLINQVAYAHTYLFSKRGGKARIVADHGEGLKAWLNGKVVFRATERRVALGFYPSISRHELNHLDSPSARFDVELQPGWNRLLLKLSSPNRPGFKDMRCCLRIMDPPDVPYDSKNILWMTPLPGRSTSTPLLVRDRIFLMAEPDHVLCLDKTSGKVLWSAAVDYYAALTPDEKKANPAYAERVDPLLARLKAAKDRKEVTRLRAELQKTLLAIDEKTFRIEAEGHFEGHFGIVGFTMATPVSDCKRVFVWNGMGVAACFDLGGKRQWITRLKTHELTYGSSPALADGVFVGFFNRLFGLDANTGKLLWENRKIKNNVAALLAAKLGGETVVITQRGDVVKPATGEIFFRPEGSGAGGDIGWSPPVILGQRVYLPRYGVGQLHLFDFTASAREPKLVARWSLPEEIHRGPGGKWVDRWTAGSPLIHDNISYQCDIYQELFALDLKTGKMLYRQPLDLAGLMHYNAVPVAASLTLVGKHIAACDNQGTTILFEPGPTFKMVARNRIATQLDRILPLPAQETLTYAPPICDGGRLYLRGEAFLYCIGEK
ncbi:MAG: PQQ-binding-like beta-propeller repeat protein [Gemmataceae bacterium]